MSESIETQSGREQPDSQNEQPASSEASQLEQLSTLATEQADAPSTGGEAAPTTTDAPEQPQCWKPAYIAIPVVDEKETERRGEEVLVDINFADLIGAGKRKAKHDLTARHYLSSAYNYNNPNFRKQKLAPLFFNACARAGFDIVQKGWEEHRQMIRFACQKGRLYKGRGGSASSDESKVTGDSDKTNESPARLRTINRSLTCICPFNFSVFWEAGNKPGIGRWFVCACGIGKATHEGHGPKPYVEEEITFSPHDIAFQQFMPQYQQFCMLASSGDANLMDFAGKLLHDDVQKLQAKQPPKPKKRRRGRIPNAEKKPVKFESLSGVTLPYASLPPSSISAIPPSRRTATATGTAPAMLPPPPKPQAPVPPPNKKMKLSTSANGMATGKPAAFAALPQALAASSGRGMPTPRAMLAPPSRPIQAMPPMMMVPQRSFLSRMMLPQPFVAPRPMAAPLAPSLLPQQQQQQRQMTPMQAAQMGPSKPTPLHMIPPPPPKPVDSSNGEKESPLTLTPMQAAQLAPAAAPKPLVAGDDKDKEDSSNETNFSPVASVIPVQSVLALNCRLAAVERYISRGRAATTIVTLPFHLSRPSRFRPILPLKSITMSDEDAKYVKLVSAEGHEFFVERKIAIASSNTIRTMLEGKFRESQENVINFPEISGYILERVVKYLYYKAQYSHSTTRIPDFTIEPEVAMELMIAAKYLDC